MYGKFFASAFTGSMIGSGSDVFAVWGYVIANAVKSTVELNPKLLASVIGSTPEKMRTAIYFLCSPDPESRSPEEDGRHLIHEGGYQHRVVNHDKYRALRNEDERREYNREAKRRERASVVKRDVNDSQYVSAHTEAEAEANKETPSGVMSGKPSAVAKRVIEFLNQKTGKAFKPTDTNLDFIVARMKEGYDEDMFRMVIARKVRDWKPDPKMVGYLRPATLFNREKFNQYAGECAPTDGRP